MEPIGYRIRCILMAHGRDQEVISKRYLDCAIDTLKKVILSVLIFNSILLMGFRMCATARKGGGAARAYICSYITTELVLTTSITVTSSSSADEEDEDIFLLRSGRPPANPCGESLRITSSRLLPNACRLST